MDIRPPKRALNFLRWFCREDYIDEVEGDLIEIFEIRSQESPRKAKLGFWWQVFLHFRPDYIKSFRTYPLIHQSMLQNYFKIAWRNTLRQKLYSSINLLGLTVGMTCFILIALYIQFELSYDMHHEKGNQIYRMYQRQKGNTFQGTNLFASCPEPLAPAMEKNFPEVKAAATIMTSYNLLTYKDKVFSPRALYAHENIFDIFTIPITVGQGKTALKDPNSILLSESLAIKYFGYESPIGKDIVLSNEQYLTVRGVFEDVPKNQHLQFEFIIPLENYAHYENDIGRWDSNNYYTYVLLNRDVNLKKLKGKFGIFDKYLIPAYSNTSFKIDYLLQPIEDVHFANDINFNPQLANDIRYIYLLASIAFIILLLAAINYMNLATARSVKRSKEIGVRKVMGARKVQVIFQLLCESFLLTSISFIIAMALAYILLPIFANFMEQPIPFDILGNKWLLLVMLALALLIGGFAGIYPAFFLSNVSPIKALKGNFIKKFTKGTTLRNVLMVGQFTAAIVLAVSSVVVYQQLEYIQNKKLGVNLEKIIYVPFWFEEIDNNSEVIRHELLTHPKIKKVSKSTVLPLHSTNQGIVKQWEGNSGQEEFPIYRNFIDYDFLDLYEIELVAGRNFSLEFATDSTDSYILNESAVKAAGWTPASAIGKGFRNGKVIGVVKDFHFLHFNLKIEPLQMVLRTDANNYNNFGNMAMKVYMDDLENTLTHIRQTFKNVAPNIPFQYHFLDDSFDRLYKSEQRLGKVFNIFTFLAILIACIGLFGLVSYSVVQRTKEIGIRKVLGASVIKIVKLLSKDFLRPVMLSFVLAFPIAWYAMQQWLNDFAYRVDVPWWVFVIVAILAIGISIVTVSFQSIKAALANPVDSLRNE